MKIRTLILMAIVVILAGCSGSNIPSSGEVDMPENYSFTWSNGDPEGYSVAITSSGYTISGPDGFQIRSQDRYKWHQPESEREEAGDDVLLTITIKQRYVETIIGRDSFTIRNESGTEMLDVSITDISGEEVTTVLELTGLKKNNP